MIATIWLHSPSYPPEIRRTDESRQVLHRTAIFAITRARPGASLLDVHIANFLAGTDQTRNATHLFCRITSSFQIFVVVPANAGK
ncbi:MAG: hypothetical protein IPO29_10715 [Anaerolineae bacterium]|nr:hypothetical protein [Anaerolineae bacterium]